MPRPRSKITDGTFLGVRMSADQKDMFHTLGGAEWLRDYLDRQIRSERVSLGLSQEEYSAAKQKDREKDRKTQHNTMRR
jgi:hypothetical protein